MDSIPIKLSASLIMKIHSGKAAGNKAEQDYLKDPKAPRGPAGPVPAGCQQPERNQHNRNSLKPVFDVTEQDQFRAGAEHAQQEN